MSNEPKKPQSGDEPPDLSPEPDGKRSGRVTFDSRGNSVWEWQLETGVYSRDVSTQRLKKLDLGDLSIAETGIQKKPPGLDRAPEPLPGGGFNPYDNAPRTNQEGFNPYDNARNLGNKVADRFSPKAAPRPTESAKRPPPRTPDELRKLSEWIKMKKNLDKDKK